MCALVWCIYITHAQFVGEVFRRVFTGQVKCMSCTVCVTVRALLVDIHKQRYWMNYSVKAACLWENWEDWLYNFCVMRLHCICMCVSEPAQHSDWHSKYARSWRTTWTSCLKLATFRQSQAFMPSSNSCPGNHKAKLFEKKKIKNSTSRFLSHEIEILSVWMVMNYPLC